MTVKSKRIEGAKRMAVRQRNYRRVRDRALTRLAQAYPETYKELLELEKVSDETTGAKWISVDGSSNLVVGSRTGRSTENIAIETDGDFYEDEGDDE